MPPTQDVPHSKEEKEFVKAAESSVEKDNRKKARRAWEKLPANSPFKKYKFEG